MVTTTPQGRTLIETALKHERLVTATLLVLIPVACWTWIVLMARDMYGTMLGPSAWMMTATWDTPHLLLLWAMWAVMMTAMMLPSAAPLVLLYAGALRTRGDAGTGQLIPRSTSGDADAGPGANSPTRPRRQRRLSRVWRLRGGWGGPVRATRIGVSTQVNRGVFALAAGYVLVWALFSVGATVLQRILSSALLLNPMMEPATPLAGAAVLAIAGIYQLTPLKNRCLHVCRSPLSYLMQHWRSGTSGAFRLGVHHGAYCLGCCWALMLLLFAGGVMNLVVIVALTLWVLVEKFAPFGELTARVSGVALLALAIWMAVR